MSLVDSLLSQKKFPTALVEQTMQGIQGNPAEQDRFQQIVEQRAGDFEDLGCYAEALQYVKQYQQDCMQVVPGYQSTIGTLEALEARITKVQDVKRTIDITPPPPPPPVRYRDPLNIAGKAPVGAQIEFYNASLPGRPVLGAAIADRTTGAFAFELTDETRFEFTTP